MDLSDGRRTLHGGPSATGVRSVYCTCCEAYPFSFGCRRLVSQCEDAASQPRHVRSLRHLYHRVLHLLDGGLHSQSIRQQRLLTHRYSLAHQRNLQLHRLTLSLLHLLADCNHRNPGNDRLCAKRALLADYQRAGIRNLIGDLIPPGNGEASQPRPRLHRRSRIQRIRPRIRSPSQSVELVHSYQTRELRVYIGYGCYSRAYQRNYQIDEREEGHLCSLWLQARPKCRL